MRWMPRRNKQTRMIRPVSVIAVLLAGVMAAGAARADFADAARAYDGGDYATALGEWRKLAEAGDAAAQVAIAGMYRSGEGQLPDPVRAARWYRRAADQGNAVAQMNLGEMYMLGSGVVRDRIAAYAWLSRAAAQGQGWAADQRERLARRMTSEDVKRARQLVKSYP